MSSSPLPVFPTRASAVASFLLAVLAVVAPTAHAFGQTSGLSVSASISGGSTPTAGGYVYVIADVVGGAEGSVTASVDPKAIGVNKFVTLMNTHGRPLSSPPCASGHQCFYASIEVDAHTAPGRHTVSVTVNDAGGRSATASTQVQIDAPRDSDNDGLPDVWERHYDLRLSPPDGAQGAHGANGDPDEDGLTNLQEFRARSHPRARYQRVFAEGSFGERQWLASCFIVKTLPATGIQSDTVPTFRVLAIGDEGRTGETFSLGYSNPRICPIHSEPPFAADRIVAVVVDSEQPIAVERTTYSRADASWLPLNASLGVQAPSQHWFFARGGTERELDLFFLTFNPGSDPVDATFTFAGGGTEPPVTLTRTLPPGVRTTIWVNQDAPAAAAIDAATTIATTAPIYVERAWRHRSPGRSVPHDSISRGASVPSTWWYFAAGDLSAAFDTSFVAFNPSGQRTIVDARFLFADRDPQTRQIDLPANSRVLIRPRELGIGGAAVALVLHARDGVGIVAERTTDGHTAARAWRQSALGVTEAGTEWTFAELQRDADETQTEIVIANTSTTNARARLHIYANSPYEGDYEKTIDVPAQRVVTLPFGSSGWLVVTSEPAPGTATSAPPPLVVERVTYVDVDGVRRARHVSIVGNLTR